MGEQAAPYVPVRMLLPSAVGGSSSWLHSFLQRQEQKAVSGEVDLAGSYPTFVASSKGFCAKETSACWLAACLVLQVSHSPGLQAARVLAKDLVNGMDCCVMSVNPWCSKL